MDTQAMIAEAIARVQEVLQRIIEKARAVVRSAEDEAIREFMKMKLERFNYIFIDVIDEFYADYTPGSSVMAYKKRSGEYGRSYARKYSLYNIFSPSIDDDNYLDLAFIPSKTTPFRSEYEGDPEGNNGLYYQTFVKGWHGGADRAGEGKKPPHPNPGVPYWRTPYKRYTRWGMPAYISDPSPLENMRIRVRDYEKYEQNAEYDYLRRKHLENININL